MSSINRQGGKKNRKWGRNRAGCHAYKLAGTREQNKVRRVVRDARRARDPLAVAVHDPYADRVRSLLKERVAPAPRSERGRMRARGARRARQRRAAGERVRSTRWLAAAA